MIIFYLIYAEGQHEGGEARSSAFVRVLEDLGLCIVPF